MLLNLITSLNINYIILILSFSNIRNFNNASKNNMNNYCINNSHYKYHICLLPNKKKHL